MDEGRGRRVGVTLPSAALSSAASFITVECPPLFVARHHTPPRPPPPPQIPFSVELEAVQALFKGEPGYTGFRAHPHRRMVFVDFVNERQSTSAMRKYQGHKLVESKPVRRRSPAVAMCCLLLLPSCACSYPLCSP